MRASCRSGIPSPGLRINVVLTAMKRSEDGKGLVALLRVRGQRAATLHCRARRRDIGDCSQPDGEAGLAAQRDGDKVTVPVTPYEIQTVRVDYTPATEK